MLKGGARILLASAALFLTTIFAGPVSLAQQADPYSQLDYTQAKLDQLATQIDRIQQAEHATQGQLDVFLRATYKEQQRSLLEYLLDSLSFVDFMTRVGTLQAVAQQQDHLLTLLSNTH